MGRSEGLSTSPPFCSISATTATAAVLVSGENGNTGPLSYVRLARDARPASVGAGLSPGATGVAVALTFGS